MQKHFIMDINGKSLEQFYPTLVSLLDAAIICPPFWFVNCNKRHFGFKVPDLQFLWQHVTADAASAEWATIFNYFRHVMMF